MNHLNTKRWFVSVDIIYTVHAEEQRKERNIEKVWIEEAIVSPDYTAREGNKYLVTKKLNGHAIEVVYVKEKYLKIITVYWV